MPDDQPLDLAAVLRAEREAIGAGAEPDAPLSALCISGGGIRSATFGLGALQALAAQGLLGKFDYLSTVSGGGYIGGWLSAWARRAGGIDQVAARLREDTPPVAGPDPVQHLRAYNNYLTPRTGALSTDLWTVLATMLRNVLLNWLVLIPLLMAALMVPRLLLALLAFPEFQHGDVIFATLPPDYGAAQLDPIAHSPWVAYVLPLTSVALFALALLNTLRSLPGVGGREHDERKYALGILAPLVGAVLSFLAYDSLHFLGHDYVAQNNLLAVMAWSIAPCVAAWVGFVLFHRQPVLHKLRLLFGPLSLAIAVMAGGLGLATWANTNFVLWNPDPHLTPSWASYVTLGPPTVLLGYFLGSVLFVGLTSSFLRDEDREWMSRATSGAMRFAVIWAALCAMVLVLPQYALEWKLWGHALLAGVGALSAWLSTLAASAVPNANHAQGQAASADPALRSRLLAIAAAAAPPLFLLLLAGALSVATNLLLQGLHVLAGQDLASPFGWPVDWSMHYAMLTRAQPLLVVALALLLLAVGWAAARWVNINTFSLHGMYRDRLVRAYLGASNPDRHATRFTGFCRDDDLPLAALGAHSRPFHVINATLNLISGERLAWQQRKAAAFTLSALHCGSADTGYRPADRYAGGISLGTAMAISGAAASPQMGYHSSPVVGFIMTLFNARLGAWLGNPGPAGRTTWTLAAPISAIRLLFREALGGASDRSEYVYLSDGGHFENLGLYEMVRRRCRVIVVLDSGCDPHLELGDLGNTLRKIRIDHRVPIEFDPASMRLLRTRQRRWATATVRYSHADASLEDGQLIYIKPLVQGTEPPDVLSYAAAHPAFPHQGTGDQWFDESQTESYRILGLQTVLQMCAGGPLDSPLAWCRRLQEKAQHAGQQPVSAPGAA